VRAFFGIGVDPIKMPKSHNQK